MSNSKLILSLLLLASATLAIRWLWVEQAPTGSGTRAPSEQGAEQVVIGMDLRVLNPDGSRHFDLSTDRLVQSAGDGSAVLSTPQMVFYRNAEPLWHANSQSAWLLEDGSEVRMDGAVELIRSDALKLAAASMTFFPYDDRVRSDVETIITQPGMRMRGIGMRADLVREIYRLLAEVRGQYAASNAP